MDKLVGKARNVARLSPITVHEQRLGLVLPEGLSFQEWREIGRDLARAEHKINWWIGDWWRYGERMEYGKAKETAEALFSSLTYQGIRDIGYVAGRFSDLSRRRDKLSFSHYREVAPLTETDPDLVARLLLTAEREGWSHRELRAEVFKLNHTPEPLPDDGCTVADLHALIASGQRFNCIYCDPPWTFEVFGQLGKSRSPEKHYDTLSIDDIKALPVAGLADRDCLLALWIVAPLLQESLEVIKAWGFEYKTIGFNWFKTTDDGEDLRTGLGYYTRANTEVCFFATRRNWKRVAADVPQGLLAPLDRHSEKPEEFHGRLERLAPGPFIDLYARKPRPGWWTWGNEISRRRMRQ